MSVTVVGVDLAPRPGAEPVRYTVEIAPTGIVARLRSLVEPTRYLDVVSADVHAGELYNIVWHHQWWMIGSARLRADLIAHMRALAADHHPGA